MPIHSRHERFCLVQVNSDILAHGCTSWLGLCPPLARSEHLTEPRSVLVLRDRILPQPRRCSRFHLISPLKIPLTQPFSPQAGRGLLLGDLSTDVLSSSQGRGSVE